MKPGIPWSIKGIESESREAAKAAARRSGMTLGQWLNSMILENAEEKQAAAATGTKTRKKTRRTTTRKKPRSTGKSSTSNEITARLDQLAAQLSQLTRDNQDTAVTRFVDNDDHAMDNQVLEHLQTRLATHEARSVQAFEKINNRLDVIDEKLEGNDIAQAVDEPVSEDVSTYKVLESAMRNIVEHIEHSEKRNQDSIARLQDKMSEIVNRAQNSENEEINKNSPAIEMLEKRVSEMATNIEEAAKIDHTEKLRDYVDDKISGLSEQISALSHSSEALAQRAEIAAAESAKTEAGKVEQRVASLLGEARALMTKSAPGEADLKFIRDEIGSLNQRFDDIKTQSASDRDVQSLKMAVEQLTTSVSAGNDMRPIHDLEQKLVELTGRLDETSSGIHLAPQFEELDHKIQMLDQQLQQALENQNDQSAIAGIEHQIATINDRIMATEEKLGQLSAIEQSVSQLYTAIEENRNWASQVAEDAASRMAEQLSQQNLPAAAGEPSAELKALEEGLAAVRQATANSDQRNNETLEAVHETLEQIIGKLTVLEEAHSRQEAERLLQQQSPAQAPAPEAVASPEPAISASPEQQDDWQPVIQTPLGNDSLDTHADPFAQTPDDLLSTPLQENVSPAFDPSPVQTAAADGMESLESHIQTGDTQPVSEPVGEAEPPLDYIAQARLASQSAQAPETPTAIGAASLLARFKPSAGDKPKAEKASIKSKFSLPFLSKKKTDKVVSEKADNTANDNEGSRKRLILAGLVLLVAAGTFVYTNLSGGEKTPVSQAPAVTSPAPKLKTQSMVQPGKAEHQIAKPKSVQNVSMVTKSPHIPSGVDKNIMPVSYEKTRMTATGDISGNGPAPVEPVTTASLPDIAGSAPQAQSNAASPTASLAPAQNPSGTIATSSLPEQIGSKSLRLAAEQGDPSAQFVIASRYMDNRTISRDFAKAANWYRKAASSGMPPAQYRLGALFERGNGVPKDLNAARLWYERAAEHGNVKAMHNLAVIYANKNSGMTDFIKARHWFEQAARHGLKDSQYNLAVIHERGLGTKSSLAKAYFWYSLAAAQGDKGARIKAHALNNHLSNAERIAAKKRLAAWKPEKPSRTGNFVAIRDKSWQIDTAKRAVKLGAKPSLSGKALITATQKTLASLGYDIGKVDGKMGTRTANAVRLFQLQTGLAVNGMVSNDLLQQLLARAG